MFKSFKLYFHILKANDKVFALAVFAPVLSFHIMRMRTNFFSFKSNTSSTKCKDGTPNKCTFLHINLFSSTFLYLAIMYLLHYKSIQKIALSHLDTQSCCCCAPDMLLWRRSSGRGLMLGGLTELCHLLPAALCKAESVCYTPQLLRHCRRKLDDCIERG